MSKHPTVAAPLCDVNDPYFETPFVVATNLPAGTLQPETAALIGAALFNLLPKESVGSSPWKLTGGIEAVSNRFGTS